MFPACVAAAENCFVCIAAGGERAGGLRFAHPPYRLRTVGRNRQRIAPTTAQRDPGGGLRFANPPYRYAISIAILCSALGAFCAVAIARARSRCARARCGSPRA